MRLIVFVMGKHSFSANQTFSNNQNTFSSLYFTKRYSIIDQHLAQHFKNNSAGILSPLPFLCSQLITPFSHLMLSANQERGLFI